MRRIRVTYHLRLHEEQRAAAERAHGFHADHCPVARSIRGSVAIYTALEMEYLPADEYHLTGNDHAHRAPSVGDGTSDSSRAIS